MYRRSRFFAAFLAAALTFGGLMATLGPDHYRNAWHRHHHMCGCWMMNDERMNGCDDQMCPSEDHGRFERHYRYMQDEPVAPPMQEIRKDTVKK